MTLRDRSATEGWNVGNRTMFSRVYIDDPTMWADSSFQAADKIHAQQLNKRYRAECRLRCCTASS